MNKLMKVMLCGVMLFTLVACGSNDKKESAKEDKKEETASKIQSKYFPSTTVREVIDDNKKSFYFKIADTSIRTDDLSRAEGLDFYTIGFKVAEEKWADVFHVVYRGDFRSENLVAGTTLKKSEDIPMTMKYEIQYILTENSSILNFATVNEYSTLVIKETKSEKINGYDFCRISGYLEESDTTDKFKDNRRSFVIYCLLFEGCPIYFGVKDRTKDQTLEKEIAQFARTLAESFEEIDEDEYMDIQYGH